VCARASIRWYRPPIPGVRHSHGPGFGVRDRVRVRVRVRRTVGMADRNHRTSMGDVCHVYQRLSAAFQLSPMQCVKRIAST